MLKCEFLKSAHFPETITDPKLLIQKAIKLDLTSYQTIFITFLKLMIQRTVFQHAIVIMILNALVTFSKYLKIRKYCTHFKWNGFG